MILSRLNPLVVLIACCYADASFGGNFKIENCQVEIMNTASELVTLEHKPIHDQLLIQQNSDLTQIQGRPITQSTINVFLPDAIETLVEFDCVPTYSKTLLAKIVSMDGTTIIPQFALKSDNKYILKKHGSDFFYILRNGRMTNDQPVSKSLLSQDESQPESCDAEKEKNRSLQRQNLVCEMEHASCERMKLVGVELLQLSQHLIESMEERLETLLTAPSNITIDLTSGRTDIYKPWREKNLSGTYHFRGIYDERPVYKRDEKIEDGRDAYLYFVDEVGWLLTHGEDFESKNKASWFIAKTAERDVRKISGIWAETQGFGFDLKALVLIK